MKISPTISRFFIDFPLDVDPVVYQDALVYNNLVNNKRYKYEHELVIGDKLRVFFDADKKDYKPITYDSYLEFVEDERKRMNA